MHPIPDPRPRRPWRPLALALALAASACATAQAPPVPEGPPAPDPQEVADRLIRATTPASPRQVAFSWELDEAGARLRGRGVVRLQAPDRLRLDLFGPRGETYLAAALVGESFRVPPAVAGRFALPSPALLWGALGVIRPPSGATLRGATASDQGASLRYETAQQETVEFAAEGERLRSVRRDARSSARESIALTYSAAGQLQRAEYRDWGAYRTLILNIESVDHVESFPEDTWLPGGAPR